MSDLLVNDIRNLIEEVGVDKIKYLLNPKEYKDWCFVLWQITNICVVDKL